MSRFKKLGLLSGILVIACIATWILTQVEEKKEQIKTSEAIILQISAEQVQKLSWEYDGEELSFHRGDEQDWYYDADEAFPVDDNQIDSLLEVFAEFGASFEIEKVEDYDQYGLEEPECTIHLETEDVSYDVKLGSFSSMDYKRYVSIGDGKVYLVNVDPLDTFGITIEALIQNDAVLSYDRVTSIDFKGDEEYSIAYMEDGADSISDEDVYFVNSGGKNLPLDTDAVDNYLLGIMSLDMTTYVTYNATDEELEKYGLDSPNLTVTIAYEIEDEEEQTVKESYVLNMSGSAEEDYAYVRVGESGIIYQISSTDYLAFAAASYNDFRHQELFAGDFGDVTGMDIVLDGEKYTLTTKTEDEDTVWYCGDEEISVDEISSELSAITSREFTDESPSGEEEIELTLYLNHENVSKIKIVLYRHNGTDCLAVVDGESVSYIARSGVVELVEAVNRIVLE